MSAVVPLIDGARWLQRGGGISSTAFSGGGRFLAAKARALHDSAASSQALMGPQQQVVSMLRELEANQAAGWVDGELVPAIAFDAAASLVLALPSGLPMPQVDTEPGGSVVLDWTVANRVRFSASIGKSGRIAWGWLFGTDAAHGVARFDGERVPEPLLDGIKGVLRHGARLGAA